MGWRFTSEGESGVVVPIGACAKLKCLHQTENEARLCYRNFILEKHTTYFTKMNDRKPCVVCGAVTDNMIEVDGTPQVRVCPHHANLQDAGDFILAGGDELIA